MGQDSNFISGSFRLRPHPRPRQLLECRFRKDHRFALGGIPGCSVLPCACSSLAGARNAQAASTRHQFAVRERGHHHRRRFTSLQVCRAAESSPSRLSQSIHPADSAVCSFHHRKTPTTRASSPLMRLRSLEQLPATYGARIHLLSPLLA